MRSPSFIRENRFGRLVRERRLLYDLSLRDLGAKTGLAFSYLNSLELGERPPSENACDLLARALDTDADFLKMIAGILPSHIARSRFDEKQVYAAIEILKNGVPAALT